jgi:hypothetical protein
MLAVSSVPEYVCVMAGLTSLQQKVIGVLGDSAVKRIPSFSVGTNRISGAALQSMGTAAYKRKTNGGGLSSATVAGRQSS